MNSINYYIALPDRVSTAIDGMTDSHDIAELAAQYLAEYLAIQMNDDGMVSLHIRGKWFDIPHKEVLNLVRGLLAKAN